MSEQIDSGQNLFLFATHPLDFAAEIEEAIAAENYDAAVELFRRDLTSHGLH